jgi:periplasmic protein TonB
MNVFREESGIWRWIVSASTAFIGILLFMFVTLGTLKDRRLPDLGPLLEIEYVTVEEPRKQPEKPPPQVRRRVEVAPPEAVPQPAIENVVPEMPLLEETPVAPAPVDVPAAPAAPAAPVAAPDQPQRIGSTAVLDNVGFEPVFNPKPDYPVVALEARITGYVDVDLVISADGKVRSFSFVTVKGHPAFGLETAKVLPQWRFPPPRVGGKKCSVKYVYRINFVLN